jgi:hypothetical protein
MWRAASRSGYRKKMNSSNDSYSHRGKGRKTSLTSWESLHHRTICPQQLASTTASSAESHLPSGKQTIVDWRRQEYDSWCIEITNFRRRHARPALVRDYLPRLACTRLRLA